MIWTLLQFAWKPLAAVLAFFGIYAVGAANARQKARAQQAEQYIDTRKRTDDADIMGDAPRSLDWLRNRDPNKP